MGKIVVIGSSNTDMVVTAPKIPVPGETILGNEFSIIAGGKGANQAVAAARAGGKVTFIAKVGDDDFGKNAVAGYKADKINTDHIFIDHDKPSGIAIIIVEEGSGQNSIVVAGGANKSLSIDDIKATEKLISEADVVLIQLEIPLEVVDFSLKLAKHYRVKTVLNPAPAQPLSDKILSLVDIITPNESETQILTGLYPTSDEEVKKAAAKLLEKVNETVIVTLGSKGVYFISRNGENGFVPTTKVEAVDTTAAGDVFNGYLAAAIADGKSYLEAISISNKAATISVTRKGAQPSIPKIDELGQEDRGLAICGSGVGACITANKVPGVRAALITDPYSARQGVEDDSMNVMCLGGNVTGYSLALELLVRIFLNASFKETERYVLRLNKI